MAKPKKCNHKIRKMLTVSAKDLALVLGISVRHVWRLNKNGKLPRPVRLGRSVKWSISEITEWVANNCPDLQTWDARKTTSGMSKNNHLVQQYKASRSGQQDCQLTNTISLAAEIILSMAVENSEQKQAASAWDMVEALIRQYAVGRKSEDDR